MGNKTEEEDRKVSEGWGENVEEVMQKQNASLKEICGERKEKIKAQFCQK